jgi:hypothetical protein
MWRYAYRVCQAADKDRPPAVFERHRLKDNMGWSGWEEFRNLIPYDKTNLQEQR